MNNRLFRVDGMALVGDLSHKPVIAIGLVGHVLGPAVGKGHAVAASHSASTVAVFIGVEGGLAVVVGYGVLEGVGRGLVNFFSHRGGMDGIGDRSSVDGMGNRGGMDGMGDRSSGDGMGHWGGMD